ncbi:hypothetical protein ACUODF_58475, partial [Escherichia coli]
PVKIDRAHQLVAGKRQLFREMLALGCQFISPSQHVADAFNSLYGPGPASHGITGVCPPPVGVRDQSSPADS